MKMDVKRFGELVDAIKEQAKENRAEDDEGFSHAYDATVDGNPVELTQGDLMYQDGQWYATTDFFEKTLRAQTRWDEEEKTLMMVVQEKALRESVD